VDPPGEADVAAVAGDDGKDFAAWDEYPVEDALPEMGGEDEWDPGALADWFGLSGDKDAGVGI
jgi:hypothetical protein